MRALVTVLAGLLLAAPALAQGEPEVAVRPFVMASEEAFSATTTFNGIFGSSHGPFWGGGVDVVFRDRVYVEVAASRFRETGQRAFRFENQTYRLGIPLTATITPIEVTGGYRFHLWPRMIPYAGAGAGRYGYTETSDFADAAENVDTSHAGFVLNGGAEFRLHPWFRLAADVQYTRVPGILGGAGLSQEANERNLGGVAARVRFLVGR